MLTKNKAHYLYILAAAGVLSAFPFPSAASSPNFLHGTSVAYVTNGSGTAACPAGALCLYADANYNGTGEHTRILVMPYGSSSRNIGDYGFDYATSNVSSVVNKTGHETGLVAGLQLAGPLLRIPAGTNIPDLADRKMEAGDWNDMTRSVISGPVVAASILTDVRGPREATAGAAVTYTVAVTNEGPDAIPDAVVDLNIYNVLDVTAVTCSSPTSSCRKTGGDGASQGLNLKKGERAKITIKGTIAPDSDGLNKLMDPTGKSQAVIITTGLDQKIAFVRVIKPPATADMSLSMRGSSKAAPGAAVAYEVDIANDGPDAVPDAVVNLDIPKMLEAVSVSCTSPTASCGKTADDGAFQALNMKNNDSATITVEGTVLPGFSGSFTVRAAAESPGVINTASRSADSQTTVVTNSPATAELSLSMRGSPKVTQGAGVVYTMEVDNHGPDAVPDAVLAIGIPKELEAISVTCASPTGSCSNTSADRRTQALNMKKGDHATVTLAATVTPKFVGNFSVGTNLQSPGILNTAPVYYGNVATTVVKKNVVQNLDVSDALAGSWGDWKSGGEIYSYRLTVTAARDDVRKWTISFSGLPEGVQIYNKDVLWTEVIKNGSDGEIILGTPKTGVHVVAAGKPLNIDLQLLYPQMNDAYKHLQNLKATQLQ